MHYLRIALAIACYVLLTVAYVRKRVVFWSVCGTLVAVIEYQTILHGEFTVLGMLYDVWALVITYAGVRFLAWCWARAIGSKVAPRPARDSTDDASGMP